MRKTLSGIWVVGVTALADYLGIGVGAFFYRNTADRGHIDELARAQVAKDYPAATVTDVAILLKREHADVREYVVAVTVYLGGQSREAEFMSTARHTHFLRWWQPTQHLMAAKGG